MSQSAPVLVLVSIVCECERCCIRMSVRGRIWGGFWDPSPASWQLFVSAQRPLASINHRRAVQYSTVSRTQCDIRSAGDAEGARCHVRAVVATSLARSGPSNHLAVPGPSTKYEVPSPLRWHSHGATVRGPPDMLLAPQLSMIVQLRSACTNIGTAPLSPSQCVSARDYCTTGAEKTRTVQPRPNGPRPSTAPRLGPVALLHASPIASWWRRRPILARRNLIRQAAPKSLSRPSGPSTKQKGRCQPPPKEGSALLLLFCLPPFLFFVPPAPNPPILTTANSLPRHQKTNAKTTNGTLHPFTLFLQF